MIKKSFSLISNDSKSAVKIEKGELISYQKEGVEFIHQKGNKGWRNSDDEMFPVIGPTAKNNFRVHTKKGDGIQDQHGFLREMKYLFISSDKKTAVFRKTYAKNTQIKNSKFPDKSSEAFLFWPFDFTFEKRFTLSNQSLNIDFIINSKINMPFMFGYHPAFLLSNSGKETLQFGDVKITLETILKTGSNAFPVLHSNKITLNNIDKSNLEITTTGFENFMLWTEVNNMLCIEPITQYTSFTDQLFSDKNMHLSKGENRFSVQLKIV